jgi:hypothetical protein
LQEWRDLYSLPFQSGLHCVKVFESSERKKAATTKRAGSGSGTIGAVRGVVSSHLGLNKKKTSAAPTTVVRRKSGPATVGAKGKAVPATASNRAKAQTAPIKKPIANNPASSQVAAVPVKVWSQWHGGNCCLIPPPIAYCRCRQPQWTRLRREMRT